MIIISVRKNQIDAYNHVFYGHSIQILNECKKLFFVINQLIN